MWLLYGYEGTFEYSTSGKYFGMGIHWSTVLTVGVCMYILTLNLQRGGLRSIGEIWTSFIQDSKRLVTIARHPTWFYRVRDDAHEPYVVEPVHAVPFAFYLSLATLFIFELPYVILLNWFQFGDLLWPIYMVKQSFLGHYMLIRNASVAVLPLIGSYIMIWYPSRKVDGGYMPRYDWKFRVDWKWIMILGVTSLCWLTWVYMPSKPPLTLNDVVEKGCVYEKELIDVDSYNWTMPKQELFPQTVYTFYNLSKGEEYGVEDLFGWWQNDSPVHLVNIITKCMVYASVMYPMLLKVERND
jgi:hypothetical protein